jgi:hypothetical protein
MHLSAHSGVRHQDVLSRKKGVKRAGFNSPSVLKTRKAQTRTPKTPSREGCAFYPLFALFPASTSKIPPYSLAREVHSSPLIINPVDKIGKSEKSRRCADFSLQRFASKRRKPPPDSIAEIASAISPRVSQRRSASTCLERVKKRSIVSFTVS